MRFADQTIFPTRPEAPRLSAGDLVLRGHVLADFDLVWHFFENSKRAEFVSAPKNPTHLWYGMCAEITSWPLRGIGAWAIEHSGQMVGQISITQPPHFPELEIGWILFDGYEGQGIAHRAATRALEWFWAETDGDTLVSYIDGRNTRSIALAERLGAALDPAAATYDAEDVVYRHRRPS